jgi:ligand-binding sensor domain-containing protein/signal transduction histidine kinase
LYKLLLIIFLLLYSNFGAAQQSNYLFHHIGIKDGLNQENIPAVQQDARGFLWIAANNSIERYDGHRFISFFAGRNGKLPSGVILGMQMDKKNRLWLLTGENSLGYFDADKFIYHAVKVTVPEAYANAGVALQVDKADNVILIYIGRGILTYNEQVGEAAAKYNSFVIPAGWEPTHFWQDDEFNYWLASPNGFLKYNTQKKILSYRGHNQENDAFIKAFESVKNTGFIYTDKSKRIWISYRTPETIIKSFNTVNGEIKSWGKQIAKSLKGTYFEVWGVRQFTDGSLWMNGSGLLARVNYDQQSIEPVAPDSPGEYSIRYDQVNNLFEDREKSIWVCTNSGLFRFNPSAHIFHAINNRVADDKKVFPNDVTGFLETADGEFWVSTWGEGIFCYDKNFNPVVSKYIQRQNSSEGMVWCMIQTKNGDIWRGAQDGVLFIYDAKTKKIIRLKPDIAKGKTIRQIAEDKNGNVWIGTQGGHLIKWNAADKQFSLQQQFKRLVSRLYVDSYNNIWACTDMDGVYHIKSTDGSVLTHYTASGVENKKLLINGASDIIQHDDTTMLIAGNGLNILNTKTGNFTYWDEGTQISNMVKDEKGNLWLSTNIGIVSRQLSREWAHITFDARDGVSNFNFNIAAGALLKNGHIVFGTNHDFLLFDPAKAMTFNFKLPEVEIAEIVVMNKRLSVDSVRQLNQLHLTHNQNSFTIKFTTNNYQNLTPVVYMIEGVDKDWKNGNSNGDVSLNYLSPGKYVLKATTKDGVGEIGKVTGITIVIDAPFYKTWWFYCLIAMAIGAVLFWLDKERMKRKEAVLKMRSDIADDLHKEINTALGNINILSEIAKLKANTEPGKSIEFIEQIHDKSQSMMIAMDDMLWSIDPHNDSMENFILRFKEYIDALRNRHGLQIDLLIDKKVEALQLNMKLRKDVFWFFKSGITNVVKTGGTYCRIHIAFTNPHLIYTLEFDNTNTDTQQLDNLRRRKELSDKLTAIKAKLDLQTHKTNSVFVLSIPVV